MFAVARTSSTRRRKCLPKRQFHFIEFDGEVRTTKKTEIGGILLTKKMLQKFWTKNWTVECNLGTTTVVGRGGVLVVSRLDAA